MKGNELLVDYWYKNKRLSPLLRITSEDELPLRERRVAPIPDCDQRIALPNWRSPINTTEVVNQGHMEDGEDELFTHTCLVGMEAGILTNQAMGKDSRASRLAELQYRNSLHLPHLKSPYPVETLSACPSAFRESEIKGIEMKRAALQFK